jgi:hypothetical protein
MTAEVYLCVDLVEARLWWEVEKLAIEPSPEVNEATLVKSQKRIAPQQIYEKKLDQV